jgi:CRP/FNR family transcriptional regulator, anaerobic regulatory protein
LGAQANLRDARMTLRKTETAQTLHCCYKWRMLNSRGGERRRRLQSDGDCATCLVNTGCWRAPPQAARIVRTVREAPLAPGDLLTASTALDVLWLVRSGAFKLVRLNSDGAEAIVDFRLPGELIAAAPSERHAPVTRVTALGEATVCRLLPPESQDTQSLAEYWRLVAAAAQHHLERALEPWASLPAVERVAKFVADLGKRLPRNRTDGSFELPMTRAELGSRLGLSEETVCRALRGLHANGRLHIRGRTVRRID